MWDVLLFFQMETAAVWQVLTLILEVCSFCPFPFARGCLTIFPGLG